MKLDEIYMLLWNTWGYCSKRYMIVIYHKYPRLLLRRQERHLKFQIKLRGKKMSDATSALISVMERNYIQAQLHEEQRATLTSIIVIIASAIQGVLTQTGFKKSSLPLTIT